MIVTVEDRKGREVSRLRGAIDGVRKLLTAYAAGHGGRYMIFGSAARGDIRFDSDFDVVADFPAAEERAAFEFAEVTCVQHGLKPDIRLMSEMSPGFIDRIRKEWRPAG